MLWDLWDFIHLKMQDNWKIHLTHTGCNARNPVCDVAPVYHQVRCMYWGISVFHRGRSHLNKYAIWNINNTNRLRSVLQICFLFLKIREPRIRWKNNCCLNMEPYCFCVWEYQTCPQPLVVICSNLGLWGVFKSVAGSFWVQVQPIRDKVAMKHCLSLAKPIPVCGY